MEQKTILITGAAGGMGYAAAKRLTQDGWRVIGLDLHAPAPLSGLRFLQTDLTDPAAESDWDEAYDTEEEDLDADDEYPDDADEDEEDPEDVVRHEMNKRSDVDAALLGAMLSKAAAGWGTEEATRQAADQGSRKKVFKVWETGANARESHQLMDGETVPIDEPFSNGADWPGDDSLDPDESCGCNCSTRVIIIEE